ncbi:PB1 domain, AUX/IAA protein [Artemisia annua]|uniref:Auxin-responsive protein n=1 Tax=Artemisia annua TaxID=35608 RepID=A0A2U1ND93_ARTAN|nr:PB1 domain, AUX/IAA protein [Artemisia annua]
MEKKIERLARITTILKGFIKNKVRLDGFEFIMLSLFSDCTMSPSSVDVNFSLNLKATELRLGLPGSYSPERNTELSLRTSPKIDEKPLFPLFPPQSAVSGSKRGFSDNEGMVRSKLDPSSIQESPSVANDTTQNHSHAANNRNTGPTLKEQVVGWPPIRSSFRKNTIVSGPKAAMVSSLFVKVSMDGAAYLRKVNLSTYYGYQGLTSALEEMFSCFLIGEYESQGDLRNEKQSETKQKHFLRGSEYVVTYVDKDDDWMLLGDVPWDSHVIATFLSLLYTCLNISLDQNIVPDEIKGREIHHSFPMTLFQECYLEDVANYQELHQHKEDHTSQYNTSGTCQHYRGKVEAVDVESTWKFAACVFRMSANASVSVSKDAEQAAKAIRSEFSHRWFILLHSTRPFIFGDHKEVADHAKIF